MRVKEVDEYMEAKFGQPDWSKSFWGEDGLQHTPMKKNPRIYRVDTRSEATLRSLRRSGLEVQEV